MIYQSDALTLRRHDGDIVEMQFDLQGESVNKFNQATVESLTAALDALDAESGVRGLIAPQFEMRGNLHYVNVDDSDVYFEIAGDWYFTPQIAAGLSVEFGGNADVWTVGTRFYFD